MSRPTTTLIALTLWLLLGASPARAEFVPGDLYVSSRLGPSISRVTPDGVVTTFVTGIDTTGLAFGPDGYLYAAHFVNFGIGLIYKVSSDGVVSTFVTGLPGPAGLAFDSSGNLYVANFYGNDVSKITPEGVVSPFATGTEQPSGLAFDSSGNLYVASGSGGYVDKITPGGMLSTFATGFPTVSGAGLAGLAVDSSDNLYVASGADGTIRKVTPGGVVSTFATGFSGRPQYIGFDNSGNLFVPEYDTGTVSVVGPGGGTGTLFATGFSGAEAVAFAPTPLNPVPAPPALVLALSGGACLLGWGWVRRWRVATVATGA